MTVPSLVIVRSPSCRVSEVPEGTPVFEAPGWPPVGFDGAGVLVAEGVGVGLGAGVDPPEVGAGVGLVEAEGEGEGLVPGVEPAPA